MALPNEAVSGWGPLYVHFKTTILPLGLRQIRYKHEEYGAIVYMVYPGVKLKTLVYVPHINLWKRERKRERGWGREVYMMKQKNGLICPVIVNHWTVINPGQWDVSIHGCTYTPRHTHTRTQRKRHAPTYIILTTEIAYSNCPTLILHKDWF